MIDVVVVGGGPAGSISAMLLARHGYAVALLERQLFPRAKPCGDCLSPAVNRQLRRLGLWQDVLHAQPAQLRGWRLNSPAGVSFSTRFEDITDDREVTNSIAIARERFDAILLTHARSAGVIVHEGVRVNNLLRGVDGSVHGVDAERLGERFAVKARLTVGADGLRSVVARRLQAHTRRPRLRKASFTMHVELANNNEVGEMRVARGACLGIAPVQAGSGRRMHNVTLVLNQGSYDGRAGAAQIVATALQRFDCVELHDPPREILTSGPFDWPVRQTVFDGAVLVGDAAGYYDPFTGQGIFQAMHSAELLSEHAARALRNGQVRRAQLHGFEVAQRRVTRHARMVQRVIEYVCARPALADQMFRTFARDPVVARALLAVTGDLMPPASLLSARLLARLAT